jgi:hypothetical protein
MINDENEKIFNAAKKYSLKDYSIKIDGPIYYLTNPYWVISYWRKKFFIKPTLKKLLILNRNGLIMDDQEIFEKVSIVPFIPYPSKLHVEKFKSELNELKYIYDFFIKKPIIIGNINLNNLSEKFRELNCLEAIELIEEIKNQNDEIANVLRSLINVKKNIINIMENLLNRKDSLLLEKFYEETLNDEKPLFHELKSLIDNRMILVRKLRKICEEHLEEIVKERKYKKLLIKNLKDEVIALFRFNSYINNKLKVYEIILKKLNEIKQQINKLYSKVN